jgi:hypothetical protein
MKLVHVSNSFVLTRNHSLHKKFIKKMIFIGVVCCCVYDLAATHIRFGITATPSLPYRFFIFHKKQEPSLNVPGLNRYVLFYHEAVDTHVIKQVVGLPGAHLRYDEKGQLWVDGFCVGKPHPTSRTGKKVNRIQPGIIPDGYIFGHAPHDRSFDSRYEEFGLIPIQSIQGVGVAIV